MDQTSAWRAAYKYPFWRSEDERTAFADYHDARTTSTDSRVLGNNYGDWMFQQ